MSFPQPSEPSAPVVWWLSPARLTAWFVLPLYFACAAMDEAFYWQFGIRYRFLEVSPVVVGAAALIAFALGSFLAERSASSGATGAFRVDARSLGNCLTLLYALTFLGYLLLLAPIASHLDLMVEHWGGSDRAQYLLRTYLQEEKYAGASLVSLQAFAMLLTFGWAALSPGSARPRRFLVAAALLALICVFRAWVWSERLAVIEIVLPVLVVHVGRLMSKPGLLVKAGPLLGIVGLMVIFGLGEYFRSWQIYQHQGYSLGSFVAARLFGYYATALNNGAAAIVMQEPYFRPVATTLVFDGTPGLGFSDPSGLSYDQLWRIFLLRYGNPEFNNGSGLFAPILDFGAGVGIAIWFVIGLGIGKLAERFRAGAVWAVVLFPVWFVGVTEVLRIFYWGDARFKVPLLAGPLIAWFLQRRAIPVDAASTRPPQSVPPLSPLAVEAIR